MEDFKKSINSVLYERLTSPFWGTLVISWLAINWKIPYVTLFVSESKISTTKIDWIISNCFQDNNQLFWFPLISTVGLLTIGQLISLGAFWISEKFKKWKLDIRNNIEKTILLSAQQSASIREVLNTQEEKFEKLLSAKDKEIELLRNPNYDVTEEDLSIELKSWSESQIEDFKRVIGAIQKGTRIRELFGALKTDSIAFLETSNVIEVDRDGKMALTPKGKLFKTALYKFK